MEPLMSLLTNFPELMMLVVLYLNDVTSVCSFRVICKQAHDMLTEERFLKLCSTLAKTHTLTTTTSMKSGEEVHVKTLVYLPTHHGGVNGVLHGKFHEALSLPAGEVVEVVQVTGAFFRGKQHGVWYLSKTGVSISDRRQLCQHEFPTEEWRYEEGKRTGQHTKWAVWSHASILEPDDDDTMELFIMEQGMYDSDGQRTGTWKKWRSPGVLHMSENYQSGLFHGLVTCYCETGKVLFQRRYVHGTLVDHVEHPFLQYIPYADTEPTGRLPPKGVESGKIYTLENGCPIGTHRRWASRSPTVGKEDIYTNPTSQLPIGGGTPNPFGPEGVDTSCSWIPRHLKLTY
jgi:hypothetical protein